MNYTKINNDILENKDISLVATVVYSKLCYRMRLSMKKGNKYYDSSYFIIYKINDLAHDVGVSRNTIIRALKELVSDKFVVKDHTMYCTKLYLPKFNNCTSQSQNDNAQSSNEVSESSKSELSNNNQNLKKKDIKISSVCLKNARGKSQNSTSKVQNWINHYGIGLVRYAIKTYHHEAPFKKIQNVFNYIAGILHTWAMNGVKTVVSAKIQEGDFNDPEAERNLPKIPIFKL